MTPGNAEGITMRRAFRKAAVTGTSLIIAVAAMFMISAPAPAHAAGCHDAGCAGLDPYQQGCVNTDISNKVVGGTYGSLTDIYSPDPDCRANWAQGTLYYTGYSMYVYIYTTDSNGNREDMCQPGPSNTGQLISYCYNSPYNGGVAWTDMVDGTNITHAGMSIYGPSGNLVESLSVDF
jgi:hypothetical protein